MSKAGAMQSISDELIYRRRPSTVRHPQTIAAFQRNIRIHDELKARINVGSPRIP
jgi:hypothetical protein